MSSGRPLTVVLAADAIGSAKVLEIDKPEILVTKTPPTYLIGRSAVAVFGVVSAWWIWRFVSVELTAAYAEGLRTLGTPEQ